MESRQGNAISIGILYLTLCEMLDVPIYAIDLPDQFILAYFDHVYSFEDMDEQNAIQRVQFFIDPANGMIYNRNDIMMYLKKNGQYERFAELTALDSRSVIVLLLEHLATTYDNIGEPEKAMEIESLIPLIQVQQPE
ncbi:Transglutaminase-like superfamily protein [compost metagenome]